MDDIARTLRWCNDIRAEHNIGGPLDELPKGEPKHYCRCPVAVALEDAEVCGDGVYLAKSDDSIALPFYVNIFIRAFDDGKYPELVA